MSKSNGSRRRCPDPEPSHTPWWALIKVLTSRKLHRRLRGDLLLVSTAVIVIGVLAATVLLVRGADVAAIVHDLVALLTPVKIAPR
jgi:hypothetical protein